MGTHISKTGLVLHTDRAGLHGPVSSKFAQFGNLDQVDRIIEEAAKDARYTLDPVRLKARFPFRLPREENR